MKFKSKVRAYFPDFSLIPSMLIHLSFLVVLFSSCQEKQETNKEPAVTLNQEEVGSGKLFIIGGGKRPSSMVQEIITLAGLKEESYGIVLPMASSEPDSAAYYGKLQFEKENCNSIFGMHFKKDEVVSQSQTDSIKNASLIYITGGDQNRFMDIVAGTAIEEAIFQAYKNGAVIAGTSAGAAVMSEKMITGNELKHPDYNATFRNIESNNIELKIGLGFIKTAIIDQHFVKRSRYNRLLSAITEYPDQIGIGIDESTAIVVEGDSARVTGLSQVILITNPTQSQTEKDGLLGANNLSVSILLPGDSFSIK